MDTSEEMKVLKLVIQHLTNAGLPYMITGSVAMNFYAVPRMTRDIDIVIELRTEDVNKLFSLFKDDFYIDREMIEDAIKEERLFNIIHNQSIIKIDFIVRKKSPYRELEFSRRREINKEGISMWLVSPEDLILSKLIWAKDSFSELQLRDVKNIMTGAENIDYPYLEKWVQSLGLESVFEKAKS